MCWNTPRAVGGRARPSEARFEVANEKCMAPGFLSFVDSRQNAIAIEDAPASDRNNYRTRRFRRCRQEVAALEVVGATVGAAADDVQKPLKLFFLLTSRRFYRLLVSWHCRRAQTQKPQSASQRSCHRFLHPTPPSPYVSYIATFQQPLKRRLSCVRSTRSRAATTVWRPALRSRRPNRARQISGL